MRAVRQLFTVWLLALFCAGPAWGAQRVHSEAAAVAGRLRAAGRLNGGQRLHLALALPLRNQRDLTEFLREVSDPGSPNYRKYLTPAQFAERFGPTEKDYAAVAAYATAHGLRVSARSSNRMILDVDGAVTDIERALHVTMRTYRHPREPRQFYAPDVDPTLDLDVPLLGIGGLDNYSLPRPRVQVKSTSLAGGRLTAEKPNTGSGPGGNYMGQDFRAAYASGVPLKGSGQTVGLLQYDGYTLADIAYYETVAGLPSLTPTNVLLDGFDGTPTGNGNEVEVSLDIEMAISMAPLMSKLIVYEAGPNGNWYDILNQMATDDFANQLSCSWYSPGQPGDPVTDGIFQQMIAQGQSFYCASGDSDAYTGLIPFPSDSPYITQAGGTTLTMSGTGGAYSSETVWNWNNGLGSGGGISTQYAIPTWQASVSMVANQGSATMHNVPDVCMVADNVYVRADGVDRSVGGTSCAAPLWAGFTALVNQEAAINGEKPVGFINPAVYAIASGAGYSAAFNDITTGNNFSTTSPSKFSAVTGYDLCTGVGSPIGLGLIYALAGPPTPMITTGALLPSGSVGAEYSLVFSGSGGVTPYTWTVSAGNLPPGLNLSGAGLLSGTPTATGSFGFSVQVTGSNGANSSSAFSMTVYAAGTPVITTTSPLTTGTLGLAYGETFTATGGAVPYSWSIISGSAPAGLTLASGGLLSGTPAASGTFGFTVQVSGSDGLASAAPFTLLVPAPPSITGTLSATGTNGAPFAYQITAANYPTSYAASGLPAGLNVNSVSGEISGTPSATGTSNVTISAINTGGTASATLVITIVQMPAPVITCPLTTLYAFSGSDGQNPLAPLTTGTDGNFYGTTVLGGAGYGTVFQLTPGGLLTPISNFDGVNGYGPFGALVQGTNGCFYGTTEIGGTAGYGNVYEVSTTGVVTSLASFNQDNGALPEAGLVLASDGNFYGTTSMANIGLGSVFQMTPSGTLTSLFEFDFGNGYGPTCNLVQGSDGELYGTTQSGGDYNDGVVFKTTLTGDISDPGNFDGANGYAPIAGVIQATDGNFYGTTYYGGDIGYGAIYQMTPAGNLSAICSFTGTNGGNPVAGLVQGIDGNFYGATAFGGSGGVGTIFMATTSGSLTTLYSFSGPDGSEPQAALIQSPNGTLYGTTNVGGGGGDGTVFALVPFTVTVPVGQAFSYQITAASNVPPTYSATNVPGWLGFDASTGLLTGTATATGASQITIGASNPGGSASTVLTITVVAPPVITSATNAAGTVTLPFTYQITANNSPTSYSASGLPAGLGINTSTGLISGTALATGTANVTIGAINYTGTGSASLSIVIGPLGYSAWQNAWFTQAQSAISGETAAPAGDGISNLLKYAFDVNPMTNGLSALPKEGEVTVSGDNYLTLTYTENLFASDLTYTPQVSGDLKTWNSGASYISTTGVIPNADGVTATVTVQDLTPMGPAPQFMRLKVTGP